MTNHPPGAERALEERDTEAEAYEAWERMAESSDALDELTEIVATAMWEAVNWPDGPDSDRVAAGPTITEVQKLIGAWLNQHVDRYDWFVAHHLIESFEVWRQGPERDGDAERDARIAGGGAG